MKHSIRISEVQHKYKLLKERLTGHEGLPLAIAMVLAGVSQMIQLRQSPDTIRRMVDIGIGQGRSTKIVMPTADEIAKLLGDVHDGKGDKDLSPAIMLDLGSSKKDNGGDS